MKRGLICLNFILFLALSLVFAQGCQDSDGGNNYYIKGETSGRILVDDDKSTSRSDFCVALIGSSEELSACSGDNCGVYEFECKIINDDISKPFVDGNIEVCEDGCEDGACIIEETCNSFFNDDKSPLKILFINLDNASHYQDLMEDIIYNQLKKISPFKENFESIAFYSISLNNASKFKCNGHQGGLSASGLSCNNSKIYEEIKKECETENIFGGITVVITDSEYGGSGGEIIYIGSSPNNDLQSKLELSKNIGIHEIGHNFGLADLYYGTFYYDGRPSQFWPTEMSRAFLNVDGPGCEKWCASYEPVLEYTDSISSECIALENKEECLGFGRYEDKSCIESTNHPDCCVWSEEPFEYFETQCVPALGSEDVGIDCLEGTGCYYGAVYGNYAWRPVLNQGDSIMYSPGADSFSRAGEEAISKVFECCLLENLAGDNCDNFLEDYSSFLEDYSFKKEIGVCRGDGKKNISYIEYEEEVTPSLEKDLMYPSEDASILVTCDGCILENKCYPLGYRKSEKYCFDETQKFTDYNKEGESCDNSFECQSNLCIDSECISEGFFKKVMSWFSKLFG
jgi:hypothetical protein